jgi:hypothetical protein
MLEDIVVIGIVMAIAELVKRGLKRVCDESLVTQLVPLVVLVLAGGLNVANAAVFAPDTPLVQALGQGIVLGAVAGGVYSMGKAALGKS